LAFHCLIHRHPAWSWGTPSDRASPMRRPPGRKYCGRRKVNYIVDADIAKFFDSVSKDWLARSLEHRIGDKRVLRLIQKWLRAGVLEDGRIEVPERGTGQGAAISPLLANVYLHYVLDLWAERWRRREAKGDMVIVRYADDAIFGFESETDARRFLDAMRERLAAFALTLHPDRTRLIEFGRFAAANRERRGLSKPETFKFLGFIFICGKSRKGGFLLTRKSRGDRMRAKLKQIKEGLRKRMHEPPARQGQWLGQVVQGWFNYHASGSANSLRMRRGCPRITDQLTQLIEAGPTSISNAPLPHNRPGLGSSGKGARVRDAGVGGRGGLRIPGGICAHARLPRRGDILSHLGQPPGDFEPN
jgi:group II intron reverse transcriptase/maturase